MTFAPPDREPKPIPALAIVGEARLVNSNCDQAAAAVAAGAKLARGQRLLSRAMEPQEV